MAYQIPNIAGLAAARNNRRAQAVKDLGTKLALRQKEKIKEKLKLLKMLTLVM